VSVTIIASIIVAVGLIWAAAIIGKYLSAAHCHGCKVEEAELVEKDKAAAWEIAKANFEEEENERRQETELKLIRKEILIAQALCDHGRLWLLTIKTSDNTIQSITNIAKAGCADICVAQICDEFPAMRRRGKPKELHDADGARSLLT